MPSTSDFQHSFSSISRSLVIVLGVGSFISLGLPLAIRSTSLQAVEIAQQASPSSLPDITTPAPTLTPAPVTAPTTPTTPLLSSYHSQLESYRDQDHAFRLAKQEYYQLVTLSSLEKAVTAWKNVGQVRQQVLRSYVRLLDEELEHAGGLEPQERTQLHQQILSLLDDLTAMDQQIISIRDKKEVAQSELDFEKIVPKVQQTTSRVTALLMFSRMQVAYEKLSLYAGDKEAALSIIEQDAVRLAEKKRGFAEIRRTLDAVQVSLTSIKKDIDETSPESSEGLPSQVSRQLQAPFGQLSRAKLYIRELLTQQ